MLLSVELCKLLINVCGKNKSLFNIEENVTFSLFAPQT